MTALYPTPFNGIWSRSSEIVWVGTSPPETDEK